MLNQSCEALPGVGPILANKLAQCGIITIQDLLFHLPYRYQDRTRVTPIQDLRSSDWAVVVGRVCKVEVKTGRRPMLSCYIDDQTGILQVRFFHFNPKQLKQFNTNPRLCLFGEIRSFTTQLEMIHPEYQVMQDDIVCPVNETLTPIYSTTHGLSQSRLRKLVNDALTNYEATLHALEWMTPKQLEDFGFQSIPISLAQLHHPPPDISMHTLEQGSHPGLKRLAFDELLAQRVSMQFAKQERAKQTAPALTHPQHLLDAFITTLPFQLTAAQQRVYHEVRSDMTQNKPMLRLVQGDVGAGKTIIAALAALQAIYSGHQVAFMAPTDILSEQHAQGLARWFRPLGIEVFRLSGKMTAKARRETLDALATQTCQLVVGTHALFQDNVHFAKLGLVIIDEQHRFGVEQRLQLQQKGQFAQQMPHQLLMTATPIPRTLAMTQFAHLDISIIDELPPGRTPIITAVLNQTKREDIILRLKTAIAERRQVYWVCTLIDDSEKLQCIAATQCAEQLKTLLPDARIGLIHGRMKANEKDTIMTAFKHADIDLLVATTVIEVGVDVPNASLMIIENAERLGLSQLHQLRGRVGRGRTQSHCLLLYQMPLSHHSRERLNIMRTTTDGFIIAEKDLALRGAGDILGMRQTGYRQFKIADLQRDAALLPQLTPVANQLLKQDPNQARAIAKRWLGQFELYLQG